MDTRGRNTWHTTEPWHNSPLPEGVSHAVTVPPGRGVGALEAPQDRHGQDHRTGISRAEQITEAMAELGALEAMAGARSSGGHGGAGSSGGHGRWSFMALASSLGQATPAGTLLPPKIISLGKLGGIRSPPGLDRQEQDRDRTALQG